MSTSGSRFKELRKELKFSQEEMGKIFNTTKSYISLVERDKSQLSAENYKKLALKYNVNLNWLIAGKGEMFDVNTIELNKDNLEKAMLELLKKNGIV